MQKELVYKQDAIDAINCDITITGLENARTVAAAFKEIGDRVKALPLAEPEITMKEVREFCRERGLTIITGETYTFTRAELEVHDRHVRQEFATECCKVLNKQKHKETQPDVRERIAGITLLSLDEYRKHYKKHQTDK